MSRREFTFVALIMTIGVIVGAVVGKPQGVEDDTPQRAVWKTLDALHKAASEADGEKYFSLFADDAVFIGTDPDERWTIEEFKAYAEPHFAEGTGWTYTLKGWERHIIVEGDIAWFDELLENAKYGTCRGSGVLRNVDGDWKIAQYVLSFTVPNDVALEVTTITRGESDD